MSKLQKLNSEISTLLCENNSDENNSEENNSEENNSEENNLKKKNINNGFLIENTNLEKFVNEKLSGNKINNRGFFINSIFSENKLNNQLQKDLSRQWSNIEIDNFKIKNNQKTILKNNNNNKKKAEVSKYIFDLVNKKLNNFLSTFTSNQDLLKKYRINIKLFLQQSSQFDIYFNICKILKISFPDSTTFLNANFNKVKTKIYKNNNSILSKNTYEYDISTGTLKNTNKEYKINIGSAKFIYYCNHTKNKLKGTIKFNWEKENIKNFMNMIIKSNIDKNIIDKLYEKIFCKEKITNEIGQEGCRSFYNTIEDIDKQFEYYYNLLKNKNLTKITEENLIPRKTVLQTIRNFLSLCCWRKKNNKNNNKKNK